MENKRDYYAILGVSKNGTESDIKSAYRKLARIHHPDQNPDNVRQAEIKFNEIREAYEILSDPNKRADYDSDRTYSSSNRTSSSWGGFHSQNPKESPFDDLFGGGFSKYFNQKMNPEAENMTGSDVTVTMQISHHEAVEGAKKTLHFDFFELCDKCNGKGSIESAKGECQNCGGSGRERVVTSGGFGKVVRNRQCSVCDGSGKTTQETCPKCSRSGLTKMNKTIILQIPKGIKNGQKISLKGLGNSAKDGSTRGNLVVHISIQ